MVLDGIDSVAWARLTVTSGSAKDVPVWLHQLTSASPKVRRATRWWLTDAFMHQGTVWTADTAAVPFLIDLLGTPEVGDKDSILELLDSIAEGYYHPVNYGAVDDDLAAQDEAAASASDAGAEGGTDEANEVIEAGEGDEPGDEGDDRHQPQRTAIRLGAPVYVALLDDPNPAVRVAAARLLVRCRSAAFDPRPPLEARRGRETHPGVAACLQLALGQRWRGRDEKAGFFAEALRAPGLSRVERVVAAQALVETASEAALDEAIDLLATALASPSRRLDADYDLAVGGGWLGRGIGWSLRELPSARLARAVPGLIAALPHIGRERQRVAASLLLAALFSPREGTPLLAAELRREQRAALEALFAAAPFWRDGVLALVSPGDRGLPDTRPALADYLGVALPPEDALGAVERPRPHRPAPFTLKAYEARIHSVYGYLHLRRKRGYRFEPGAEVDLYSPEGFHLFYFSKTPEAVMAMEREGGGLDSLPRVPPVRWHPSSSNPATPAAGHAFMGGWCLLGEPLTPGALERLRGTRRWAQFAVLLAKFLRELHAQPPDRLPPWLPPADGREAWERTYAEVRGRFFDFLPHQARRRVAKHFETFLAEPSNWAWAPTVVHGNFAPRNIQYCTFSRGDPAMSGIQGGGRVGLGDPATDLALLLGPEGYGEEFVRHFAEAYPSLEEELLRARFYASACPLRDALNSAGGLDRMMVERLIDRLLA